ncbi:hypothetical protein [Sphingomonas sp. LHG3406-1]|uniref:hypothetical protein n=1 Tax=Sphingomonas sp. LHG3406-1 TaxID=2804617 RepID=UPI002628883D|nr:hypothetical protein [Sphingomonas sp. LHG3406-1]
MDRRSDAASSPGDSFTRGAGVWTGGASLGGKGRGCSTGGCSTGCASCGCRSATLVSLGSAGSTRSAGSTSEAARSKVESGFSLPSISTVRPVPSASSRITTRASSSSASERPISRCRRGARTAAPAARLAATGRSRGRSTPTLAP